MTSPYITVIDGRTHPDEVPAMAFTGKLVSRLRSGHLSLPLGDAALLGRFAYDDCINRPTEAEFLRRESEPLLATDPGPEVAGRHLTGLMAQLQGDYETRWGELMAKLSDQGGAIVRRFLEEEILPDSRHRVIDFAGLWAARPDKYQQWRDQPPAQEQTLMAMPVTSDGKPGIAVAVGVGALGPSHCAQSFAQVIEASLIAHLAEEYSLDDSLESREAYLVERGVLDLNPEAVLAERQRKEDQARALEAVLDGMVPDDAYQEFLATHDYSREMWEFDLIANSAERVSQLREQAAQFTVEARRQSLLQSPSFRGYHIEAQLAEHICRPGPPEQPAGTPSVEFPIRSERVQACLSVARRWYLDQAETLVPDGPDGWGNYLRLFHGVGQQ
ncbi:MAG: hypothetical protein QNJ40_00885 [Xanthomonadales bacterium]|nr:hypothetical protein [Xanthomonadales bacterium]